MRIPLDVMNIYNQLIFNNYAFIWLHRVLVEVRESLRCIVVAQGRSGCGAWSYWLHSTWDPRSPSRDQTCIPCIGRQILNHWTTKEVPIIC